MYTLKVKNHRGEELILSGNKNYTVYKVEGLSPPKANINTSANTTTDGSTVNSTRLDVRNIVIYATIEGDAEKNRINLYKYFPSKKQITLYYANDTRDVYIEGIVELVEVDPYAQKQIAQISIICPSPYFKACDDLITAFGDITSLFEFEFAIEEEGVEFSTITKNARKTIVNAGDVDSGTVIELYALGEVKNPIIYDVLKKTHMALNFTMHANDLIIINTNVREKGITLIRDGVSSNALGYMKRSSSWLYLEAGDNVFTYEAENGALDMQLTFKTPLLYSGV